MLLKSYSKINLTLKVNKKLKKDNLHNIQSYYSLINLHDKIQIKIINGTKDLIRFNGKFAKYVSKSKNSIQTTLDILRKRNILNNYFSILIEKNIPVFAGLGGGTSNSVFLTKYFVKNNINENLKNILTKKIGSDFRLFFHKQGFVQKLHKIYKFNKKYKLNFVLVYPNIRCSTRIMYSKIKRYSPKSNFDHKNINNKRKFLKLIMRKNNDLQGIVEKNYPKIKKLIEEIGQFKGCYFSRLTGSGSVCYGVFKTEKAAKNALRKVRLKHPKYWSSFAKTI